MKLKIIVERYEAQSPRGPGDSIPRPSGWLFYAYADSRQIARNRRNTRIDFYADTEQQAIDGVIREARRLLVTNQPDYPKVVEVEI